MMQQLNTPARALVALALLLMVCCASVSSRVEGIEWKLKGWTLSSLSAEATGITATLADGKISGFSGVNTYGGACRIGTDGAFSAGTLGMSKMAGPEPAMRAEGAYVTLLRQAMSYKVVGNTLTLYDAGGNESLIFEATDK